jgi:predicted MPP superfamily phosphohydrolase
MLGLSNIKNMRTSFATILLVLLLVLTYAFQLPLFLPVLYLLIIAEISFYKKVIRQQPKRKYWLMTIFFVLPWLSTIIFAITSIVYHHAYWKAEVRIYSIAVILSIFVGHLPPLFFYYIQKIISKKNPEPKVAIHGQWSRRKFIHRLGWTISGLSISAMTSGFLVFNHRFKIHFQRLGFESLASSFNGFRILQISDMHLGSWDRIEMMSELVDLINRQEADIVVFTGDLVDYMTSEAYRFEDELARIKAKVAIYAILGNHDYGDYFRWDTPSAKEENFQSLIRFYRKLNWKLLRNESLFIEKEGKKILLSGVENWGDMKRYQKLADLEKTYQGFEDAQFKILLSHNPVHWEKHVLNFPVHIDLSLCGHTHGGQIGIELKNCRWSPIQYLYHYWAGWYEEKNKLTNTYPQLYVNRGTGSIGYPGRLGILPEITVIELFSKKHNKT